MVTQMNEKLHYFKKHIFPNIKFEGSMQIASYFLALGITDFYQAIDYVHQLPYGRNSDRTNYLQVLSEKHGACSTKHALIAELARSLNIDLRLKLGLILLDEKNSPSISNILRKYSLASLPEAHVYLDYHGERLDLTFPSATNYSMTYPLLKETFILPEQIGEFKIAWHKAAIKEWLASQTLPYGVDEIWKIRELCIAALN